MTGSMPAVPLDRLADDDPREVGGYRLLGRLGAGGMGIAYLAEAPDGWAVVKTMWPNLRADPGFRARLGRELDAMRAAASPRVVRVLAQDLDAASPWFAMEFVPGVTLQRRVQDSGALAGREVRGLAEGLADALVATSAAGVVHRDLKPANVMLSPEGPVLIDFGVADMAEATQLTRTGLVVGSAGWLAPEQITGGEVAPAADIHAWGLCVLYAATGIAPFAGENTTATIYQVLHAEPEVPASLGQPLAALVQGALSKAPEARPSAVQVRDALVGQATLGAGSTAVAAVAATSVGAYSPPPPPPAGVTAGGSRGRGPLLVAAGVAVALLLVGVGMAVARSAGGSSGSASAATPVATSPAATAPSPAPAVTVTETATVEPAPLSSPSKASPKPSATKASPKPATPARIPTGQITSVSSSCPNSLGVTGPELLVDGDTGSGWRCDNRPDNAQGNINTAPSVGESVDFYFSRPYAFTAIDVDEGASSNPFRWCENGRLREVTWDFNDGQAPVGATFPDRVDFPAGDLFVRTDIPGAPVSDHVTMIVNDIYGAGSVCTDNGETGRPWEYGPTAKPSEIRFFGYPA